MGPKSIIVQRTLYDIRDQKSYTIAKLPDGNCWMTQNLSLGSTEGTMTLTSADSNVSSSFVLPQAQATSDTSTSWGDAANTSNTPHLYATGNTNYGNYYNWYAATAGTGTSDGVNISTDATNDICPKGWRLPDGGASTSKSFRELDIAMGGTGAIRNDIAQRDKFIAAPYSFPYSGYYDYAGGVYRQGSDGYWWSRSASTTAGQAYSFRLYTNGNVYPQNSNDVGYGFSVRCILDTRTLSDISTMQEMTPTIVANTATGASKTLTDARDNSTYTVKKLLDGNIWMTQNLKLVGSRVLTSADSDVSSGFTLTASDSSTWCTDSNATCINKSMVLYEGNTTYGAYYNWYAATAGTGVYSLGENEEAGSSICPRGWRLPTGGHGGEFEKLYGSYNSFALMTNDDGPHFVMSGARESNSTYNKEIFGVYWSSTARSNSNSYDMGVNKNSPIAPINSYGKHFGLSVRCVAR